MEAAEATTVESTAAATETTTVKATTTTTKASAATTGETGLGCRERKAKADNPIECCYFHDEH
jgi:hypothetical protein